MRVMTPSVGGAGVSEPSACARPGDRFFLKAFVIEQKVEAFPRQELARSFWALAFRTPPALRALDAPQQLLGLRVVPAAAGFRTFSA